KELSLDLGELDLVCGGASPVVVRAGTRPRDAQTMLQQQGMHPQGYPGDHDDGGAPWLGLAAGAVGGLLGVPGLGGGGPAGAVGSVIGGVINGLTHGGSPQHAGGYGPPSPYGYPPGYGHPTGYGSPVGYGYPGSYPGSYGGHP